MWEPRGVSGADGKRYSRLVLELVNPRNGRTVFTADSGAVPGPATPVAAQPPPATAPAATPGAVAKASPSESRRRAKPPAPPARAKENTPGAATEAAPAAPARSGTPQAGRSPVAAAASKKPTAARDRAIEGGGTRVPDRDARLAGPVQDSSRPLSGLSAPPPVPRDPRRPSLAASSAHGTVYFENAKLAERVAILQERVATLADGQMSVRFVMTCRKGKKTLEMRCEFYDDRGLPAGTVENVELEIREGRPDTISLASRKLAVRYVLFIRD